MDRQPKAIPTLALMAALTAVILSWSGLAAPARAAEPVPNQTNKLNMPDPNVSVTPTSGSGSSAGLQEITPKLQVNIPTVKFSDLVVVSGEGERYVNVPWIAQYLSGAYKYAVGIGAFLATIMIMIGGFMYLTAGDSARTGRAKTVIGDAVLGLAVLLGSYLLLNTVNPGLTTLDKLKINVVKQEKFVSNETSADDLVAGIGNPASPSKLPYVGQWNYKNVPYTDKNGRCPTYTSDGKQVNYSISSSGCGVASAAMVVAGLTGQNAGTLVAQLAKLSSDNGFRPCDANCNCNGTSSAFFTSSKTVGTYGLAGKALQGQNEVLNSLKQGIPVIMLQKRGVFTSGGHYVVFTGLNPDGTAVVNDPGHNPGVAYKCDKSLLGKGQSSKDCSNITPFTAKNVPLKYVFQNWSGSAWIIQKK